MLQSNTSIDNADFEFLKYKFYQDKRANFFLFTNSTE